LEILRYLVEQIGPRWAGRSGAARAAEYLAQAFRGLGLRVERQTFPFLGWEVDSPPSLEILEPEPGRASVALMEFTGSTPAEGVEGELREAGLAYIVPGFLEWPRYAVVTGEGNPAGYLVAHIGLAGWLGPAIPLINPEPCYPFPGAILAQQDQQRFQTWLQAGKRIRVRFRTRGHYQADFNGHNVIATLPGASDCTVVLCAHLDTAYGTPGANNNAGGLQSLYEVAKRLVAAGQPRLTYQFLACDASEWHFLGSRYFLLEERARGRLKRILAGINIDTVASGDRFYFLAWPETMRRRAEHVVEQLKLRQAFRQVEFLGALAGSDHHSFIQAGIPASEILFWPCNVYKLPEDDATHVDGKLIELSAEIAYALAHTFEEDNL
jgi:aminopeptidase YwaD